MYFFMGFAADGSSLCIAVKIVHEESRAGEVVMVGFGSTDEAAQKQCTDRLIADGWPEHEATPGRIVYERALQ